MGAIESVEDPASHAQRGIVFRDRHDAGCRLARRLEPVRVRRPVVVAIPRGGVPVAAEVARALGAPLDVAVVRKIGSPRNPEFAIGALAEGGVRVLSDPVVRASGLSDAALRALIEPARCELDACVARYRGAHPPVEIAGRAVILVDDGLATGRSALAAVASLRARGAASVMLAVPVAAPASLDTLDPAVDEIVCVHTPDDLWAVGMWYEDFRPTVDAEVAALLAESAIGRS
jgi:putative phosphoribosyl transferase